jgi:hypothetical protein
MPTVYKASQASISMLKYFEDKCDERTQNVNDRFKAIEELFGQRFEMQDRALELSTKSLEDKMELLNNLRNEVLTDRARFITVDRADADHELVDNRIKQLEMWQSKMYGIAMGIALVAGISGGLVTKIFG